MVCAYLGHGFTMMIIMSIIISIITISFFSQLSSIRAPVPSLVFVLFLGM